MTKYPIIINEGDVLHNMRAIRHIDEELVIEEQRVNRIHTAWKLDFGSIMVYEYNSRNQPSSNICFFDTVDDYIKACEDLDWVMGIPLITTNQISES